MLQCYENRFLDTFLANWDWKFKHLLDKGLDGLPLGGGANEPAPGASRASDGAGAVSAPPTNRGAEPTNERPSNDRVLIDWFTGVWESIDRLPALLKRLDWVEIPRGRMGYRTTWRYGDLDLLLDGRADMGVCLVLSGSGCRYAETLAGWSWPDLVASCGDGVTRLDIAFDDVSGLLDRATLSQAWRDKSYTSKWRKSGNLESREGRSRRRVKCAEGWTLNFGSRQSGEYLRIYDKAEEQAVSGHWLRVELELKQDRAVGWSKYVAAGDIAVILGSVTDYLTFRVKTADTNASRWPVAPWWEAWIARFSGASLDLDPRTPSMAKAIRWLDDQVCTTLAMVYRAAGPAVLASIILAGESRFRERHIALMRAWETDNVEEIAGVESGCGRVDRSEYATLWSQSAECKALLDGSPAV